MLLEVFLIVLLFFFSLVSVRFIYVVCGIHKGFSKVSLKRGNKVKTAIVIGSGGHTAEVLRLLQHVNPNHYSPRIYIMASTDTSSESKIHKTEKECFSGDGISDDYEIIKIPRSRNVGQSYVTSIVTTLVSVFATFPVVFTRRPELIICNGPGTCIPVCAVAFLMRLLWITNTKIVFIESICRVETLSLSGKILLLFADEVLVQWPKLQQLYRRTRYIGRLT